MAVLVGQSELIGLINMAEWHINWDDDDTDGKYEVGLWRGRDDFAVDVITIVGKILWR